MTNKQKNRVAIIKARISQDEKKQFLQMISTAGLSQSDFIRQAIFQNEIKIIIRKEHSSSQLQELIGEYGKIGSNLNQIAKHLNQNHMITNSILDHICSCLLQLDELKLLVYETLENDQWQ